MQPDPFAHLNLEQTDEAERRARVAHSVLWCVAEAIVFLKDPPEAVRGWIRR